MFVYLKFRLELKTSCIIATDNYSILSDNDAAKKMLKYNEIYKEVGSLLLSEYWLALMLSIMLY